MPTDPYSFSNSTEYRDVVLRIYADNDIEPYLFAETLPYLASRQITLELSEQAKVMWLALDENITFLLYVALKLKGSATDESDPHRLAMMAILSSVTSGLTGIRQLVGSGMILPALQLCRPLRDAVNVGLLSASDQNVAEAFVQTVSREEANNFWHQFLSRDKDLKAIDRAVVERVGSTAVLFGTVEAKLNAMLGMMVHPSHGGGAVAMESDLLQMFEEDGIRVRFGYRPLSFALHQAFRALLGLFEPSIVHGRYVNELVPDADREKVAAFSKSLIILYLLTITRIHNVPAAAHEHCEATEADPPEIQDQTVKPI